MLSGAAREGARRQPRHPSAQSQEHLETRAQTEARESARHKRRLRELHDQRQKLVQLY